MVASDGITGGFMDDLKSSPKETIHHDGRLKSPQEKNRSFMESLKREEENGSF